MMSFVSPRISRPNATFARTVILTPRGLQFGKAKFSVSGRLYVTKLIGHLERRYELALCDIHLADDLGDASQLPMSLRDHRMLADALGHLNRCGVQRTRSRPLLLGGCYLAHEHPTLRIPRVNFAGCSEVDGSGV